MLKIQTCYNIITCKYFIKILYKINNTQTPKINYHHLQFNSERFDINFNSVKIYIFQIRFL